MMGRMYAIMRAIRFLVKCEMNRGGPSADGTEVMDLLDTEIELDEKEEAADSPPEFVRPPEEAPIYEGREKEDEDEDAEES